MSCGSNRLTKAEAQARIDKLKAVINNYRFHYHVHNRSVMSEAAADSLKHELTQLEAIYPELVTPDSPTQRVAGQPLPEFVSVAHRWPMLSLNDVFNETELLAWEQRMQRLVPQEKIDYMADLKLDGLACSLVYEDGVLVRALTRGDGRMGEDVTLNARTIESIPLRLQTQDVFSRGYTEVRGEIVLYQEEFERINAERQQRGEPLFANPRNLAAGTMRQLNPQLVAERPLQFHAYELLREDSGEIQTHSQVYETLKTLGFRVNEMASEFSSLSAVLEWIHEWEDARQQLPFHTDGAVIKVDNRVLFTQLGVVGKAPRGAVAYKYPAEQAATVVRDIVISIGRTGAATPVAVFDPVAIAGTTVQHASLHNADEIERKDVRIGDTVIIYKAGDIIPQVERVVLDLRPEDATRFDFAAALKQQHPDLEFERPPGEAVTRVKGASGPVLLKRALRHFVSRGALDIEGMGEKNVAAVVDAGLVSDLADIYTLTVEQLLDLERFGEISARKLVSAIQAAKRPTLPRFIFGLGIRHVGAQTAQDLSIHFGSMEAIRSASLDELEAVEGIGTVVAEAIAAWFGDEDNVRLLAKFAELGVVPKAADAVTTRGNLQGKIFVITGTLAAMSRDEAAEAVRSRGGKVSSSVSSQTDYVVVGESPGASKLKQAQAHGTAQLDEAAFTDLLT